MEGYKGRKHFFMHIIKLHTEYYIPFVVIVIIFIFDLGFSCDVIQFKKKKKVNSNWIIHEIQLL